MIKEARECSATHTCDQVREKFADLNDANDKRLSAYCAGDPSGCRKAYESLVAESNQSHELLSQARVSSDIPESLKHFMGAVQLFNSNAKMLLATGSIADGVGQVGSDIAAGLGFNVEPSQVSSFTEWAAMLLGGGRGAKGAKGAGSALETTNPIAVSGSRAIDKAQSYEGGVRGMYGGNSAFEERQFRTVVDGKIVNGVADDVAVIGGKKTAIEAKFVDDWGSSLRNPASPSGSKPWSVAEQTKMVDQAKKYSSGFDGGAIYHTNSPELASYYSKVFTDAGVTKFKFVITPATK